MASFQIGNDFLVRRQVLTLLGAKFQVFDPAGKLLLFSHQKAFRLKEDIRIYGDESMQEERLLIRARQVLDFAASYDVIDAASGAKVGALRRKALRSVLRDSWEFLDNNDQPFARIEEDSTVRALIRRFLTNLLPQSYHATAGGKELASFKQNFNPFVYKLTVSLRPEGRSVLDPRLAVAAAILLAAIEGKQG